jgi:hypothetical protein
MVTGDQRWRFGVWMALALAFVALALCLLQGDEVRWEQSKYSPPSDRIDTSDVNESTRGAVGARVDLRIGGLGSVVVDAAVEVTWPDGGMQRGDSQRLDANSAVASFSVPVNMQCRLCVEPRPDRRDGCFVGRAVLPVVRAIPALAAGSECEVILDFAALTRQEVVLIGEAASMACVDWSVDFANGAPSQGVRVAPIDGVFEVIADGVGISSMNAMGVGISDRLALVEEVTGLREFQFGDRSASSRLRLRLEHQGIGRWRVKEGGDCVGFAVKVAGVFGDVKESHALVSLEELRDAGVDTLWFLTARGTLFDCAVQNMVVDANGDIVVHAPSEVNEIVVSTKQSMKQGYVPWLSGGPSGGVPMIECEGGWRLKGLSDGNYFIHWVRLPRERIPLAEVALPGVGNIRRLQLQVDPPALIGTEVVVENWAEMPFEFRRGTLYVEGVGNAKPPQGNAFSFSLGNDLSVYQNVQFVPLCSIGALQCHILSRNGQLRVRIDFAHARRVRFVARLGGRMRVECGHSYADLRGSVPGAFRSVVAEDIASLGAWCANAPAEIRVFEILGDGASGYRGAFVLHADDRIVDPDGRFLQIINETGAQAIASVIESVEGRRLQTHIATIPSGGSNLWIPETATSLVVETRYGTRRVAASIPVLVLGGRSR